MRLNDQQLGRPEILYKDTKANIEALAAVEGMAAYATDTNEFGTYDGSAWTWGSVVTTRWEPLTNGDPSSPELVFDPANGDVFMIEVEI